MKCTLLLLLAGLAFVSKVFRNDGTPIFLRNEGNNSSLLRSFRCSNLLGNASDGCPRESCSRDFGLRIVEIVSYRLETGGNMRPQNGSDNW